MWREIGGSFEDGVCFVNWDPSVLIKRQQDMLLLAWVIIISIVQKTALFYFSV